MGDTVYAPRGSLQSPALREAGQHGVGNSGVSSLLRHQEPVMLRGQRDQLIESSPGHKIACLNKQSFRQYLSSMELY